MGLIKERDATSVWKQIRRLKGKVTFIINLEEPKEKTCQEVVKIHVKVNLTDRNFNKIRLYISNKTRNLEVSSCWHQISGLYYHSYIFVIFWDFPSYLLPHDHRWWLQLQLLVYSPVERRDWGSEKRKTFQIFFCRLLFIIRWPELCKLLPWLKGVWEDIFSY